MEKKSHNLKSSIRSLQNPKECSYRLGYLLSSLHSLGSDERVGATSGLLAS